ncbi:MAG: DUF4157 domain-containing protein [Phycisphaerales bacterium]|nr:MAG: DUF4157 domain-containing protein [Phycisphaerales bacterium]
MSLDVGKTPTGPTYRPMPDAGTPIKDLAEQAAKAASAGAAQVADGFVDADAKVKAEMQELFKQQFGGKAQNKAEFHKFMQQVFGKGYDQAKAEQFRQQALKGDYSWLPPIEFVDSQTLRGANGAYDAEKGVVYINSDLKSNPQRAASTYVEEAGHHLDTQLNKKDTLGDEGEMFRRVLSGEKLTATQMHEIRTEDDKGVITVDGKQVAVEFWNPFKAIGNAIKKVGKAIGGAVKKVGNAIAGAAKKVGEVVVGAAKGVGKAVASVGKGIFSAGKNFFVGLGTGIYGFASNLVQGRFREAFDDLIKGADKAFLQAPLSLVNGAFDAGQNLIDGFTPLLGPLGKPLNNVLTRGWDAGRTLFNTGGVMVRSAFRMVTETPLDFVFDLGKSAKLLFQGKFGEAAKQFGMSFVNVPLRVAGGLTDIVASGLQGAASAFLTAIFVEPPSRGLTDEEREILQSMYGDTIDYDSVRIKRGDTTTKLGMAAHAVGNTIYLPDSAFGPDGKLTDKGKQTLVHEAAHVWQNQSGGPDYIHDSLFNQAWATITGGDRNAAYDWRVGYNEGKSFRELNAEQQAKLIEDYYAALNNPNGKPLSDYYTDEELAYVQDAYQQVRQGTGAV